MSESRTVVPRVREASEQAIPLIPGGCWIYMQPLPGSGHDDFALRAFLLASKDSLDVVISRLQSQRKITLRNLSDLASTVGATTSLSYVMLDLGFAMHPRDSHDLWPLDDRLLKVNVGKLKVNVMELTQDASSLNFTPVQKSALPTVQTNSLQLEMDVISRPAPFMYTIGKTLNLLQHKNEDELLVGTLRYDGAMTAETVKGKTLLFARGRGLVAVYVAEMLDDKLGTFKGWRPAFLFRNEVFPDQACITRLVYAYLPGKLAVEIIDKAVLASEGGRLFVIKAR